MAYDPNKVAFLYLTDGQGLATWEVPGREAALIFTSPFTAKQFVNENLSGRYLATEVLASGVQETIKSLRDQGITEVLIDFRTPSWSGGSFPVTELARYQGLE
jgi:hypothetical protein